MKFKLLSLAVLGSAISLSAQQGYYDGVEYYRADQPEEATIILEKTISDPSTDKAVANYYLGQIRLQAGNIAEAQKYFDAGLAANPENGYNYVGLGAIALRQGNKSAAETQFKKAKSLAKKRRRSHHRDRPRIFHSRSCSLCQGDRQNYCRCKKSR